MTRFDHETMGVCELLIPFCLLLTAGCASLPTALHAAKHGTDMAAAAVHAAEIRRAEVAEACKAVPSLCDDAALGTMDAAVHDAKAALEALRDALQALTIAAETLPPKG